MCIGCDPPISLYTESAAAFNVRHSVLTTQSDRWKRMEAAVERRNPKNQADKLLGCAIKIGIEDDGGGKLAIRNRANSF